jgi:serine/threonine-protein kinase
MPPTESGGVNPEESIFLKHLIEREVISRSEERQLRETLRVPSPDEAGRPIWDLAVDIGIITRVQADRFVGQLGLGLASEEGTAGGDTRGLAPVAPRAAAGSGGKRLGPYRLISKLGQGGMGAVYKGCQETMDRLVAVKVLPRSLASDKEFIGRFNQEARAAGRLNHPNIVAGIDAGFADGYYYFAMEYVEGTNLADRLEGDGPLDEAEVLEVGRQVARALDHAHSSGVLHRDVKPENIILTPEGVAKLCDLGLARTASEDLRLTRSGVAVGTPDYISPEQINGEPPTPAADIYSLGCTLFHLATGRVPFDADAPLDVMRMHLYTEPPGITEVRPELSAELEDVIARMMSKKPAERQATAGDVADELEALLQQGAARPAPGSAVTGTGTSGYGRVGDRRGGSITRTSRSTRSRNPAVRRTGAFEADEDRFGGEETYRGLRPVGLPIRLIICVLGLLVILAALTLAVLVVRSRAAAWRARTGGLPPRAGPGAPER